MQPNSGPAPRVRQRKPPQESKFQLVGAAGDPQFEYASRRLREFRSRHALLVRMFFVSVSGSASSDAVAAEHFTTPQVALAVDGIPVLETLGGAASRAQLEHFLEWDFLGQKALQLSRAPQQDAPILRQYVHEATRTTCFLVAHRSSRRCVIIDPLVNMVEEIEKDVKEQGFEVVAVCLTHAFFDAVTAHDRWPSARLVAGEQSVVHISPADVPTETALTLESMPAPAYCSDGVVFSLRIGTAAACFFTGPAWPLDALPRVDLAAAEEKISLESAMGRAFTALVALRDMIFQQSSSSSAGIDPIVFPSHGGYSNCTNQLDLHWSAPVSALSRMRHTKQLLNALDSFGAFAAHMTGSALPLPTPSLYRAIRWLNRRQVAWGRASVLPGTTLVEPPLIDLRSTEEYCAQHVRGAVNFPMTFPGARPGAKKAELWIGCFVPIPQVDFDCHRVQVAATVMCSTQAQMREVRTRLASIGIGVAGDLGPGQDVGFASTLEVLSADCFDWAAADVVTCSDRSVTVGPSEQNRRWMRLASHWDLSALDASRGSSTIVLDCRTPYEFKNGSHNTSVHIPLAELCALAGSLASKSPGAPSPVEDSLDILVKSVVARSDGGMQAPVESIAIYCAAGYRSHIAVSLFQMLLERAGAAAAAHGRYPIVRDVVGGALRVMTHRPDLWQVKDRSIVCIS